MSIAKLVQTYMNAFIFITTSSVFIFVMMTVVDFQDEGTFQMKQPARDLLKRLGSKRAQVIGWRDMWAMVTQKGAKMFGESYSKSTDFNTWGAPVVLRTEVPLIPTEG
jgi:beta-1,2-N-acetylglucosaminyltransferase